MRLLLIEDDHLLASSILRQLKRHYVIDVANCGEKGLHLAYTHSYELIILDLALPDKSGKNLLAELRENQVSEPVMIITGSKFAPQQSVGCFRAGADAYLTKPFGFDELLARIKALLRRAHLLYLKPIQAGPYQFDPNKQQLFFHKQLIQLNRKETLIIETLFRHHCQIVTKNLLLNQVWDKNYQTSNSLEVHICQIRRKVDKKFGCPLIKTEPGKGYRLCEYKEKLQ